MINLYIIFVFSFKIFSYVSSIDENVPRLVHVSWGPFKSSFSIMWSMREKVHCQLFYSGEFERQQNLVMSKVVVLTSSEGKTEEYWYKSLIKLDNSLRHQSKISYNIACRDKGKLVNYKSSFKANNIKSLPTFMVFGDLSSRSSYLKKVAEIGLNHDAIFHLGDISYNLESRSGKNGNEFLEAIEIAASKVPYLTVPGDHEIGDDGSYTHYSYKFSNPVADFPMSSDNLNWCKDIDFKIMIIGLNSQQFANPSVDIIDWLEVTLSRTTFTWRILLMHQPLYCSEHNWNDDCKKTNSQLRNNLEGIFVKHNVDLVLSGHIHAYERSWPMANGKPTQLNYHDCKAPVYVTTGTTGNDVIADKLTMKSPWSAVSKSGSGTESYGILKIKSKELNYKQISLIDSSIIDSFTISKRNNFTNFRMSEPFQEKQIISGHVPINFTYFLLFFLLCIIIFMSKRRFLRC